MRVFAVMVITKLADEYLKDSHIRLIPEIVIIAILIAIVLDVLEIFTKACNLAAKEPKALLRPVNDKLPDGCHCSPGNCMAPVIMGFQTPCRDPQKAAGERK